MVTRNAGEPAELESFDPAQLVREEVQRRSSPWRFQAYFEDTIWQYEPPNRLSFPRRTESAGSLSRSPMATGSGTPPARS